MPNYTVTVIKSGNSYALRVPKRYVDDAQLALGQKTTIPLPTPEPRQDRTRIQELLRRLQELGTYQGMEDPAEWQRKVRKDRPLPGRK